MCGSLCIVERKCALVYLCPGAFAHLLSCSPTHPPPPPAWLPPAIDGAGFYCIASNSLGTATSSTGILRVSPAVVVDPSPTTVPVGSAAAFSVVAVGAGLSYDWLKGGVSLGAANSPSLSYLALPVDIGVAVSISCKVSNTAGFAISAAATLTTITTPSFPTQPSNAVAPVGGTVTFTVAATGGALTLQWYRTSTGASISGATTPTLTLSVATGGFGPTPVPHCCLSHSFLTPAPFYRHHCTLSSPRVRR